MSYQKILEEEYIGKKVTVDMEDVAGNSEVEWEPDDEDEAAGSGVVMLTYDDKDDDPKTNIQTSLYFEMDENGRIAALEIQARVFTVRKEKNAAVDPEECWTAEDLLLARRFLDELIR